MRTLLRLKNQLRRTLSLKIIPKIADFRTSLRVVSCQSGINLTEILFLP